MTSAVEPPSWTGAANARNLASAALRMTYRVRAHGAHHVGTSGALLMVTRCEGVLAGALVHATAPRPVHVVANEAMDRALPERALSAAKFTIGRVGTLVAEEGIQLHGGIGMTWELPLAHYAKRLVMIDHQLGDEDFHLQRYIDLGREALV